nr:MAG TPA: hypothetical protein [Herelleviridae sp.]
MPGPRVKFYPIIIISKEKSNFNSQNIQKFSTKIYFFLLSLYHAKSLKSNFYICQILLGAGHCQILHLVKFYK